MVTFVSFPSLVTVLHYFEISSLPAVVTISAPLLQRITYDVNLNNMATVTSILFPSLYRLGASINLGDLPLLTSFVWSTNPLSRGIIDGINMIPLVDGNIVINTGIGSLDNIDFLYAITTINGYLSINLPAMISVTGLCGAHYVRDGVNIADAPLLCCDALNTITSNNIGGDGSITIDECNNTTCTATNNLQCDVRFLSVITQQLTNTSPHTL